MAIKTVKIDYNGEKTGVEFETDLTSKVVQKILREVLRYHPLANYIEDWMETFQNLEDLKKQDT